jgi:hypothetical protein
MAQNEIVRMLWNKQKIEIPLKTAVTLLLVKSGHYRQEVPIENRTQTHGKQRNYISS